MELEIKKLSKSYGKIEALADMNATLTEGIYGLLGPNGAGKSTLIGMLTDTVRRTEGEILWDGEDIRSMGERYRGLVGYVPQYQACYPQFTLREYLRYMAALKGLDAKSEKTRAQIEELIEELHLGYAARRRLGGFSGGMRQRAMLAQALLGNPSLLILDEPTAGLDPSERIAMRNLIARIAKDKIVLLATHIATDVECVADRVLLLKKGQLIKDEKPIDLLDEVRPHIRLIPCTRDQLEEYQDRYKASNCIQTAQGLVLHVIDRDWDAPADAQAA
ncbi:MAG: ATP-binding cassette domain-containing protein, partial [Clostridiales bacterium]|nr:ATP-binding cassette domain-containing protein [Clostridiales bacterium]